MINIKQRRNGEVQLTMSPEELRCIIDAVFQDAWLKDYSVKEYSALGSQVQRDYASEVEELMTDHKRLMAIYNELVSSVDINHINLGRKGGAGHGRA